MSESILETVRIACNVGPENTDFDNELILYTNSVLAIATQLGVGPKTGFRITGESESWEDFLGDMNVDSINTVQTYIGKKVKQLFDPPVSSAVKDSLDRNLSELEWRVNVAAESVDYTDDSDDDQDEDKDCCIPISDTEINEIVEGTSP